VGGGRQAAPSRNVEQETVTLVPSKKEYEPNDTAEILVQAPFAPAEVVVTTRRNGMSEVHHLSLPTGSGTVKVPLQEVYIPGLTVQVDAVGSKVSHRRRRQRPPRQSLRPAYASGSLNLAINNSSRKLTVDVTPESKNLEPGSETNVNLKLKDSQGRPVSGEVALVMVD